MAQTYAFRTPGIPLDKLTATKKEILMGPQPGRLVCREEIFETAFTWQIPFLYFKLRVSEWLMELEVVKMRYDMNHYILYSLY